MHVVSCPKRTNDKKWKSWQQKVTQLPETFVRLMKPLCGSDVRGMDPHNGT